MKADRCKQYFLNSKH